jgi:hypothetical protein
VVFTATNLLERISLPDFNISLQITEPREYEKVASLVPSNGVSMMLGNLSLFVAC